jgi:hypothetical protein
MNKQHRDFMLQKEYEEKQKSVRAAFLQLRWNPYLEVK